MISLAPILSIMIVLFFLGVLAIVYIIKVVIRQAKEAAKSDYRENLESWHFDDRNHQNLY